MLARFRAGAGDDVRFVPAEPPTRAELYVLAERVALRVTTWLRNRGHAKDDDDDASNVTPERSFAEELADVATQRGTVENVKDDSGESEDLAEPAAPAFISKATTGTRALHDLRSSEYFSTTGTFALAHVPQNVRYACCSGPGGSAR